MLNQKGGIPHRTAITRHFELLLNLLDRRTYRQYLLCVFLWSLQICKALILDKKNWEASMKYIEPSAYRIEYPGRLPS